MITVVVRVWMPDRPGALGQVASQIGTIDGDVLAIEILEQGAGRAIDELTIAIPGSDRVADLAAVIGEVDEVSVESVREVEHDHTDANLAALALGAAVAECQPDERLDLLCAGIRRCSEADWAVVLEEGRLIAQIGESPDLAWLVAFLAGSEHLDGVDDAAPSDLLWANMLHSGLAVAAGREERPIRERERVRFSLLARLADALIVADH